MYPQYNIPPQVPYQQCQLLRVNGMDSAKAYPTVANSTIALFDANEDFMYIKSTDASNFPTIRKFRFEEVTENEPQSDNNYITVQEFNALKEELLNVKQLISDKQSNVSNKRNDEFRKNKQ